MFINNSSLISKASPFFKASSFLTILIVTLIFFSFTNLKTCHAYDLHEIERQTLSIYKVIKPLAWDRPVRILVYGLSDEEKVLMRKIASDFGKMLNIDIDIVDQKANAVFLFVPNIKNLLSNKELYQYFKTTNESLEMYIDRVENVQDNDCAFHNTTRYKQSILGFCLALKTIKTDVVSYQIKKALFYCLTGLPPNPYTNKVLDSFLLTPCNSFDISKYDTALLKSLYKANNRRTPRALAHDIFNELTSKEN